MSDDHSIFGLKPAKKQPTKDKSADAPQADSGKKEASKPVESNGAAPKAADGAKDKPSRPRRPRRRRSARKPRSAAPQDAAQNDAPKSASDSAPKSAPESAQSAPKQAESPEASSKAAPKASAEASQDKPASKPRPKRRRSSSRRSKASKPSARENAPQASAPKAPAAPSAEQEPAASPAAEKDTTIASSPEHPKAPKADERSSAPTHAEDAPAERPEPAKEQEAPKQEAPAPAAKPKRKPAQSVAEVPEDETLPEITLSDLPQHLQDACARAGWDKLMPVQAKAIPYLLANRDLMIQSRTGSGKTGSFGLPILDRVEVGRNECQALVLVPTRELAQQVAREIELLAQGTGLRTVAVFGGTSYKAQLDAFREGAHVVVGTPGRVLDHLLRGSLSLKGIDTLVFDEADRMLSIGFYPDMKQVQTYLPRRDISMLMTSATYPPHVLRLAGEFMDKPQILSLSSAQVHVAETPHVYFECPAMQKDRALVRIIELENPATGFIFCNTKQHVHYLTTVLKRFGYDADELSGDLTQAKREKVLERLRKRELRFLITTDVAARGIDIPDISHVFMYEPPEDHEVYIHRAGRTGRAGASGEVISLVDVMERLSLERIAKTYSITLEKRDLPSDDDLAAEVGNRVTALLEARFRDIDAVTRERLQRFVPLVRSLSEHEDIVQLVAMLLDETYQKTLHDTPQPPTEDDDTPAAPKDDAPRSERKRPSRGSSSRNRGRKKPAETRSDSPRPKQDAPKQDAQQNGDTNDKPKRKRRPRRRRKKKPATNNNGGQD